MSDRDRIRGIRGASCIPENTKEAILAGTGELLQAMLKANPMATEEIISIFFTLTPDLTAAFPAEAARRQGMTHTPLLCMQEIDVPASLPKVVRILILANSNKKLKEISHVFLGEAKVLRDDLVMEEE